MFFDVCFLRDPLPDERRVRRHDHAGVVTVVDRHRVAVLVEHRDVFRLKRRRQGLHRPRRGVPPAQVEVRHHEVAVRVRRADHRAEVGVRAETRIRRQEVGIARVVSAGRERDGMEERR